MKTSVFGLGYVGAVTAGCLARPGTAVEDLAGLVRAGDRVIEINGYPDEGFCW